MSCILTTLPGAKANAPVDVRKEKKKSNQQKGENNSNKTTNKF
jgi:hypothetical protein